MATKNDVTGDSIQSRAASQAYSNNWDAIFKKKPKQGDDEPAQAESTETTTTETTK